MCCRLLSFMVCIVSQAGFPLKLRSLSVSHYLGAEAVSAGRLSPAAFHPFARSYPHTSRCLFAVRAQSVTSLFRFVDGDFASLRPAPLRPASARKQNTRYVDFVSNRCLLFTECYCDNAAREFRSPVFNQVRRPKRC